jgi:hypothetical protein
VFRSSYDVLATAVFLNATRFCSMDIPGILRISFSIGVDDFVENLEIFSVLSAFV